jgi:hypothetical protein
MGDRLHPFLAAFHREAAGPARGGREAEDDHLSFDVGERYCVIGPHLLVEKGDEYLDQNGRFVTFSLEAVGRPVPPGLLARRPLDR